MKESILINLKVIMKEIKQQIEHSVNIEITYPQMMVINAIFNEEETTSAKVADALNSDRSTTAEIIRRLIDRGLIIKRENVNDKRSSLLSLSKQAIIKRNEVISKRDEVAKKVFSSLSKEENDMLDKILAKVVKEGCTKCH